MKDKKEKIKAVATAIAIVLLGIGANIGLTLGVANAVQAANPYVKIVKVWDTKEVERLTKTIILLEGKMNDVVKENASLKADLETVVKNLVGEIKYTEKLNKIFPKWRKYFVISKGVK